MDLENEDGLEVSGSPSDTGNGSEQVGSPTTNDSENGSSPEEENQTSLEAMKEALNASDESEDKAGGKQDVKTDEGDAEVKPESDKEDGEKENKTKSEAPTDEELLKPLPEGTSEKTAERFEKLTEGYKTLKDDFEAVTSEKETLQKYHDDVTSLVQHSGATPEEFNELIEYSHLVKTGKLEDALAVLDVQRAELAKAIGKPVPGVDLFVSHPDLQEQIDNHEITETAAAEIVKAREIEAQRKKQEETLRTQENETRAREQSQSEFNAQVEQAQNDVMTMVSGWEKNDINFSAKQAVIVQKVEEIGKKYPPEQWAEVLQLHYDAIKVEGKPRIPGNTQRNTPLRPQGGGGGKQEPKTSLDAMKQALNNA